jgi:hypothetical protein
MSVRWAGICSGHDTFEIPHRVADDKAEIDTLDAIRYGFAAYRVSDDSFTPSLVVVTGGIRSARQDNASRISLSRRRNRLDFSRDLTKIMFDGAH